ncbi:exonuclease [Natronorubrum sp. JWXQ-INN-674]|uniref:Exonuclease n=1 Tax=Natronorubrum halalkaliphilum TaxID=2691917 RepID=A0A6B0VKG8_9EURY|nr:exonuclease [Natronorubrum halalkaliphilum]MXV62341.1 exonuclease [Natronorubrum halalkaliphilum]
MATERRSAEPSSAPVASALESAGFAHIVARADGDALATSGLLARALTDRGTPFQVSVGRTVADRTARVRDREPATDDVTIGVGAIDADVTRLDDADRPATLAALDVVREIGSTPDPVLALAGLVAADVEPGAGESEWILETARERGLVERRPGVGIPTGDPVDGIAHSTRLRAPWSGDPDATRDALEGLGADLDEPADFDGDDHRAIASAVALDVVGDDEAAAAAAETIQRALRPYATPDHAFATVGGYADVLEATARTEPGTGAALAMGHGVHEPALAAWREDGRRAHAALEGASTGRYDGLFVVGIDDGPVETVARIAATYRSPEPVVLAVGDGEAAIATRGDDHLGATVEAVARELGADDSDSNGAQEGVEYDSSRRRGYLRYDTARDESTIIAAVRERL